MFSDYGDGISAVSTESNWSSRIGVHFYWNAGQVAAYAMLGIGIAMATECGVQQCSFKGARKILYRC
jgi:sulfite exporter TauE/SafE